MDKNKCEGCPLEDDPTCENYCCDGQKKTEQKEEE